MHFYYSGGPIIDQFTHIEAGLTECRLFSTHSAYMKPVMKWLGMAKDFERYPKRLLLDSGAFTAWNKGRIVTVEEVIRAYRLILDTAEQNGLKFEAKHAINLDVIPGQRGRTATQDEIELAQKQSDINLRILQKEFGEDFVLPVFHQDESGSRLKEISEQSKYICLSPRNDLAEDRRNEWAIWAHSLCPNNETHGLATTGINMTYDSPWTSVDSASWVHLAIYGKIYVPFGNRKHIMVNVSDNSSYIDKRGDHYMTMTEHEQEHIRQAIAQVGFTVEQCQAHFRPRAMVNIAVMEQHAHRAKHNAVRKPAQRRLFT